MPFLSGQPVSGPAGLVPPLGLLDASQPGCALVFLLSCALMFLERPVQVWELKHGRHVVLISPGLHGDPGDPFIALFHGTEAQRPPPYSLAFILQPGLHPTA